MAAQFVQVLQPRSWVGLQLGVLFLWEMGMALPLSGGVSVRGVFLPGTPFLMCRARTSEKAEQSTEQGRRALHRLG